MNSASASGSRLRAKEILYQSSTIEDNARIEMRSGDGPTCTRDRHRQHKCWSLAIGLMCLLHVGRSFARVPFDNLQCDCVPTRVHVVAEAVESTQSECSMENQGSRDTVGLCKGSMENQGSRDTIGLCKGLTREIPQHGSSQSTRRYQWCSPN